MYLHVPFCSRRCSYCDFAIAVRRRVPVRAYIRAIEHELSVRAVEYPRPVLDTLYLGGGTPSRLGADGVGAALRAVRQFADLAPGAEVTIEANPEDITADVVRSWREHGVNRLSIGIQSFDDRVLAWMHRVHNADAARRAVHAARAGGIDAFSVDLIFAVPETLNRDWERDVADIAALEPQHVSLYGLTIEAGTPLGRWHARGDALESPEERYEAEFLFAHAALSERGFDHYEVSNFSLPGQRARHNSAYWQNVPYLGVGPAAHGFDGKARRWNVSAYASWQHAVEQNIDPVAGRELLTPDNKIAESVYLGLRTTDGLAVTPAERSNLESWFAAGWLEDGGDAQFPSVHCTPKGWLRLDALAADLTARRSRS